MKALLIDDHAMFRDGVSLLIAQRFTDLELLHAATLAAAVPVLARHADLDLVLLDLGLPDSSGLNALVRLRAEAAHLRIVVLSGDDSSATVRGAIDQGACGFIPKTAQGTVLETALRIVLKGGVYVPSATLGAPRPDDGGSPSALGLTTRQLDVLRLLIEGAPNKVIARALDMSESTVKTHLASIFSRLGVNNRTQAVFAAARLGLRFARV